MRHLNKILFVILLLLFSACDEQKKQEKQILKAGENVPVNYAEGFSIVEYEDFKILTVKNPWPASNESYKYLLAEKDAELPKGLVFDQKIIIPVEKIVVTSTTHIPSLEILNKEATLVGFPGLDHISSGKTRKLINEGKIKELGQNEALNTEILLNLSPDVVIGFAIDGNNKTFDLLRKKGIPVVYNADWIEPSPLGKAEWVKFFGAFYNKTQEAIDFFEKVEKDYSEAKKLAEKATTSPTVIAGSMFQDIWYLPAGESWHAQFFEDANSNYFYSDTEGTGSLSLPFEKVFSEAKNAEFWIGPAQFQTYKELKTASLHYTRFEAFQNRNIYTYSSEKGDTGGVIFYELAPIRPDLVLKDLISILHPELLPNYETIFYKSIK